MRRLWRCNGERRAPPRTSGAHGASPRCGRCGERRPPRCARPRSPALAFVVGVAVRCALAAAPARRSPAAARRPATQPRRRSSLARPRSRFVRLVRALGRLVDRARPQLGLRQPRARLHGVRARRRSRRRAVPRRGLRRGLASSSAPSCVWSLAGKVSRALRGLRAHRAAARAGRLLERARAARRHRAPARPLGRARTRGARRHPARLRLDRRDRAHVLARRGRSSPSSSLRSGSRSRRAAVESLARARRGGRPRGRGRRVAVALDGGDERRPAAHALRVHDGLDLRRGRAAASAAVALRPRPLRPPRVRASAPRGAPRRRRRRRRRARRRGRGRGVAANRSGSGSDFVGGARSRRAPGRLASTGSNHRWTWWKQAVARLRRPPRRSAPARARSSFTNLRLPDDEPRPDARAARPAAPVPDRDRRRRLRALRRRRRGWLASSARAATATARPSSRSRSRCPRTSCTGCSTSTGTSSP